jgi:hypothetical protein
VVAQPHPASRKSSLSARRARQPLRRPALAFSIESERDFPKHDCRDNEADSRDSACFRHRAALGVPRGQQFVLGSLLPEGVSRTHGAPDSGYAPLAHRVFGEAAPAEPTRQTRVRIPYAPPHGSPQPWSYSRRGCEPFHPADVERESDSVFVS